MSKKMSLAEARELIKGLTNYTYLNSPVIEAVNTLLEATEPKGFMVYWFDKIYLNKLEVFRLNGNLQPENEYRSKEYSTASERDKALYKWAKRFERKPLFTFEGHEYFEGDRCWYFKKHNYEIFNSSASSFVGPTSYQCECDRTSKLYPTREACEEGLRDYVWKNHKLTLNKYFSMEYGPLTDPNALISRIIKLSTGQPSEDKADNEQKE